MEYMKYVGEYCRCYRSITLNMTLKRMAELTGINIKTISAFENGRSTNMEHFSNIASWGMTINVKLSLKVSLILWGLNNG